MPFGDKKGPDGRGPKTGRGLGDCGGYETPGSTKDFNRQFAGRGFGGGGRGGFGGGGRGSGGRGRGGPGFGGHRGRGGFGGRGRFGPFGARVITDEEHKAIIEDEIKFREDELKAMQEHLEKINKEETEES